MFLIAFAACGAESPRHESAAADRVWVGEVANSDVALGIVASAHHSTLFFCGGNSSYTDHTHWFLGLGPLAEAAPIEDGPWRVTIDSLGERIEGRLVINGLDAAPFSAQAVSLGKLAGVTDPEQKRKIIGAEFIRIFEESGRNISAAARRAELPRSTMRDILRSLGVRPAPAP